MNVNQFVYDPDAHWCNAGKGYYETYVPDSVDTVSKLEDYLLNDTAYEERMLDLHRQVGEGDPLFNNAARAAATVRIMKNKEAVIERCGDLAATNEYRLLRGRAIYSGTLAEVDSVSLVEHGSEQWWFARGIDGTLLNNAEEVTAYISSVVRERKYHDSNDNLSVWLAA